MEMCCVLYSNENLKNCKYHYYFYGNESKSSKVEVSEMQG